MVTVNLSVHNMSGCTALQPDDRKHTTTCALHSARSFHPNDHFGKAIEQRVRMSPTSQAAATAAASIKNDVFILEVQKRPILWDNKHKKKRTQEDILTRLAMWDQIGENVVENWKEYSDRDKEKLVTLLKNKWRNLRDHFAKELALQQTQGIKKRRPYIHFQALMFLASQPSQRETNSNVNELSSKESLFVIDDSEEDITQSQITNHSLHIDVEVVNVNDFGEETSIKRVNKEPVFESQARENTEQKDMEITSNVMDDSETSIERESTKRACKSQARGSVEQVDMETTSNVMNDLKTSIKRDSRKRTCTNQAREGTGQENIETTSNVIDNSEKEIGNSTRNEIRKQASESLTRETTEQKDMNRITEALLEIIREKKTYDEDISFTEMLVPVLKKLNDDQKHYAKMEILHILHNAKRFRPYWSFKHHKPSNA